MALQLRRTLNALSSTAFLLHNLATSTTSTNLRSQPFRSTSTASSFSPFNSNNKKIGPDTAMSGIHEIAFCGTYTKYTEDFYSLTWLEWYSIKVLVPDLECPSSSSEEEEEEVDKITIQKKPLRWFSSVKMAIEYRQHAVIGSHLYSIGGLNPDGIFCDFNSSNIDLFKKPCRLDLNCPKAGWKTLPSLNFPKRWNPPSVTLDGKLYVMGNFRGLHFIGRMPEEIAAKGHGWMEVYDPMLNTWEPLPNPPSGAGFETNVPPLLCTALPSRKQILVARPDIEYECEKCSSATFYIYNVITRSWTTLVPPNRRLNFKYINWEYKTPVVVDNTLYWALFADGKIHIHAYNIDTEMWFHGIVDFNSTRPIFWNHECMFYSDKKSSPLLHLADQKFCLLLHSSFAKRKVHEANFRGYLTSVILDVSPILDEGNHDGNQDNHDHHHDDDDDDEDEYDDDNDVDNYYDYQDDEDEDEDNDDNDVNNYYDYQVQRLNISILSVKKYPLVKPIMIWDNVLLNR